MLSTSCATAQGCVSWRCVHTETVLVKGEDDLQFLAHTALLYE